MNYLIAKQLLLPPGLFLLSALFGLLLLVRRHWLGFLSCLVSFLGMYAISTPYVGYLLSTALSEDALSKQQLIQLKAEHDAVIVVLTAGCPSGAVEFNYMPTAMGINLERARYAAYLYRQTTLPILVSGGGQCATFFGQSEALALSHTLRNDFSVPVRYVEKLSQNTAQNALLTAALLARAHKDTVVLVTSAVHMRRAARLFRRQGLTVFPAGTHRVNAPHPSTVFTWLPSIKALSESYAAVYEWTALGIDYLSRWHTPG